MSDGEPLVEMLMHYHQHASMMAGFRSDPEAVMEQFNLPELDRAAVRSALEGDFVALDIRLRNLLPFNQFPSDLHGWQQMLLMW